ncbi:unnamed protein product [Caenorhabditis bovis]|uniref:Uncharacterized protein n=1 Tax=Caenorhabditis bovis TaxID=2654633 RepID=A0A8S1E8I2_9PELO|nr:unnamed protein product [Caenorhabditis bovis]
MKHPFQLLILLCGFEVIIGSVFRIKRQIAVNTNADTNGVGDLVDTDASAHHYKNVDGVVGMNVTSNGHSKANGSSSVINSVDGSVGSQSVSGQNNIKSIGDESNSFSDIFAAVEGEQKTLQSMHEGKASGKGETFLNVNGGGSINSHGETKNLFKTGKIGATGSLGSQSQLMSSETLTWDSLMTKLAAAAVAEGSGNAQANLDLVQGTDDNNLMISGLVSGNNVNGGIVNAQVNGNGNVDGEQHDISSNMNGEIVGKLNSTLIAASDVKSNNTSAEGKVKAFANINSYSDKNSSINLDSETGVEGGNGNGHIVAKGSAEGAENDLLINNGLKIGDQHRQSVAIGSGQVHGSGSDQSSNAKQTVDTSYSENGEMNVLSKGEGLSKSNDGKNSSLILNVSGNIMNQPDLINNSTFCLQAFGGGKGPSAAETNAELTFGSHSISNNGTVYGRVEAFGDNTKVESHSSITENGEAHILSNFQRASSSSAGSSSASASNSGHLYKKKR